MTLPCAGQISEIAPGGAVRRRADEVAAGLRVVCARVLALVGVDVRAWPAGGSTRSTWPTSMALALDRRFQRTRSLTLAPCLRAIW